MGDDVGTSSVGREGTPRLVFLDGLRGLAALYVVLHHAALLVPSSGLSGPAAVARYLLRHGHYAVPVFITLSGYSLMLRSPGEMKGYLARRARRILPPYYAALGLCWLLTAALPALSRPAATPWDRALPAFPPAVIVSHLLLVHNFHMSWIYRVAPPLWSLATEWQIYMLFPALLEVRRRFGIVTTVAAGFAVGSMVALVSVPLGNPALRELCPWYVGLFAIGMAGASGFGARRGRLSVAAVIGSTALIILSVALTGGGYLMLTDTLTGAATAGLVVRCARASSRGASTPALRLLESPRAVALGGCSYSLYLIHYPLLAASNVWMRDSGLRPDTRLALLIAVAAPACVGAAAVFARAFERTSRLNLRQPFARIAEPIEAHAHLVHQ